MASTTGYFRAGDSWLHARNPLTKLFGLGFVLLAAFLLPPLALVPSAVVLVVLAVAARLGGALLGAMRIPAVLLLSIVLINALLFPGAGERWIGFGPFALTPDGLAFGLVSAGRLLVVFVASVLFLFTTLADDLMETLVARGVSHRIAFVVLSAVQLVPRMQARAAAILDAQQARGLAVHGSLGRRLRALVPLIGPVVLGSLVDVRERTFALEARGFGALPTRTAYRLVADPPVDRWLRGALVVACVAVVLVALTGIAR
jgi:energy-coupling factor transport system permease protein